MHTVHTKSYTFGHQQASVYTLTDKYLREKDAHCLFIHLYDTGSIIPYVSIHLIVLPGFQRLLQNIAVRK